MKASDGLKNLRQHLCVVDGRGDGDAGVEERGGGWGAVYDRASRGSRSKLLHGGGEVTVARGSRGGDGASDKAVGDVSDSRKIFLGVPASHFHYQGRYAGRWKKLPPWGMWDRGFSAMAVGMPKLSGITSEAHARKDAARGASTGTSQGRGTRGSPHPAKGRAGRRDMSTMRKDFFLGGEHPLPPLVYPESSLPRVEEFGERPDQALAV